MHLPPNRTFRIHVMEAFDMTKKARTHKLCEMHPLIAAVLALLIPTATLALVSSVADKISVNAGYLGMVIAAVVVMLLFKAWFSPEFKGFVKPGISAKTIGLVMIPFFIFVVLSVLSFLIFRGTVVFKPTLKAVLMGLSAGFGEEGMFRIFVLAIVMRFLKKENRALRSVVVLSIVFGLSHIGNIGQGADPGMTVAQVFTSLFTGLFLAAIYLRSGSVILPIFAHAFYDWACFVTDPTVSSDGIVVGTYGTGELIYAIVTAVLLGVTGIYMLRKSKRSETNELWNRKWSYTPAAEPAAAEEEPA